jgi:saccharopine dehydrogenase-like NADP-dependent oxidoreductase
MDIQGKSVLVLGGFGLVGSAVARKLVHENPGKIIITSLHFSEAENAVAKLRKRIRDSLLPGEATFLSAMSLGAYSERKLFPILQKEKY